MIKNKSIFVSMFGNVEKIGSERYFIAITCFVASVFVMFLCILHLSISLKKAPVFIAFFSSLVLLGLYFLVRSGKLISFSKIFLTLFGLIMLDLTWYSKYLSNGPLLFFILIFGALIIWVWEGRSLAYLLAFYFANIVVLAFIDYNAPPSLYQYPNHDIRSIDIFVSFIIYSSLLIFLLSTVKKEFTRQKDKAIKSDELKSAFLANMSHEIRTPVNAIVGFSELLEIESDPELRKNYSNIIQKSSENLLKLINEIIDLSRIEAGYINLNYSSFSIKEMFIELKEIYTIELNNKLKSNVSLNYDLPEGDYTVVSDNKRVNQIVANLISNAIKFTTLGEIKFSCIKKDNMLQFKVTDTGTGIPDEDQSKIFDRFVKFNYDDLNTEGSGIGLSVIEKTVQLLKGQIWLESEWGVGSSFYFTIPYVKPAKKQSFSDNQKNKKSINLNMINKGQKTRKKVLLVEDDIYSFLLIKKFLEPFNFNLYHADNGKKAIEFAKANPDLSLILMDLKLPEVDGYEATRAIKKINPGLPIIAQTAFAITGDKEKAMNFGFDDYISKPVKMNELQRLIEYHVFDDKP